MSEAPLFELLQDIRTPGIYMRAGAKKTEAEWRTMFPDIHDMRWERQWFKDLSEPPLQRETEPRRTVNEIFEKEGLHSISYKEAAVKACIEYGKHVLKNCRP